MGNLKILIVDDDYASRMKMATLLKPLGSCDMREDGWHALVEFNNNLQKGAPYHLIILDIEMPGMSGGNALNKIRQLEEEQGIAADDRAKIIMVTSHNDRENVMKAMRLGCDAYIVKPFTQEAVFAKLNALGLTDTD